MTEFLEDQAFGSETVMIDITGTDERGEKTQFTTEGLLLVLENESALVYHEIDTEEHVSSKVIIRFDEKDVTVLRGSEPFSSMILRQGQMCESEYRADGRSLMLRTFPTEVKVQRDGARGRMHVVYQVTLSLLGGFAEETGVRTLDIAFRPAGAPARSKVVKNRAPRGKKGESATARRVARPAREIAARESGL